MFVIFNFTDMLPVLNSTFSSINSIVN